MDPEIYAESATLINAIKSSFKHRKICIIHIKSLSKIIGNLNIFTFVRNIFDLSKEVLDEDAV
jgi:hypothetical protein